MQSLEVESKSYKQIPASMVRKKLDERVRTLIERGVVKNERSILVLVGDHGKDQVPNIHQLLTKTSVRARPKVLWCYKKELGFSTHRMKVSTEGVEFKL